MPSRTEGVAQEVERLFSGMTEARLGGVNRQAELLQPTRHLRQACFRLAPAGAEDDEVIGIGDDLAQPFTRPRLPPVAQKTVDVHVGQQRRDTATWGSPPLALLAACHPPVPPLVPLFNR